MVASGHVEDYAGDKAVDGDASSYWEGPKSFPATLTVDLGRVQQVGKLTFGLPPVAAWEKRSQEITVLGSSDGDDFRTLAAVKSYVFDPASGNNIAATVAPSSVRYVRLEFASNSAWPAAQLAALGVFAG